MYGTWVLLAIILISSVPVAAVYLWFRLKKYPFKTTYFLFSVLLGATAVFPALILQWFFPYYMPPVSRVQLFYNHFIHNAFTEETSRLFLLFIFFLISNLVKSEIKAGQPLSWSTLKKGTAAGFIAGLGFAILENAAYAISNPHMVTLLLLRTITASPLHAACGSRVGAAAVMFRTNPVQAVFRFITAIAIHGVFNLMLAINRPVVPVVLAVLISLCALITSILSIRGSWQAEDKQ